MGNEEKFTDFLLDSRKKQLTVALMMLLYELHEKPL
jgi:hypothetical protein